MEFPVLFLGATPKNTPALYSLMNYTGLYSSSTSHDAKAKFDAKAKAAAAAQRGDIQLGPGGIVGTSVPSAKWV